MDVINVAASCDNHYAQHLSVMLVSLFENNPGLRFRIFILTTADPDTLGKVAASCSGYPCRLEPLRVDPGRLRGVPVTGYASAAVYYRLILDEVLPPEVGRVLYLDSDIVVTGPISDLWAQELEGNVVGAVADEGFRDHRKLGLAAGENYFNSGVLLVDLERWRREGIGQRAIAVARDEPHRITWWDQCALNLVLRGRWLPLDRRWNLQTDGLNLHAASRSITAGERRERLRTAAIIHFTTQSKPWQYMCDHPAKQRYWHYLAKTAWRDYRMPDLSAGNVLRRLLVRSCPAALKQAYWTVRRRVRRAS
jgi:lipopolysaccharide biosynthesis glycosyltransferase